MSPPAHNDLRVLVLMPAGKDYALVRTIFDRNGITAHLCPTLTSACEELTLGAGALLAADEVLIGSTMLTAWLQQQQPWSDLPILLMARPGVDYSAAALVTNQLGNVTILDRPTRVANLVSAVQSALRARKRQYQIREHLADQKQAHEQLRANDQRKDEFLAMLAHELRNPLAPISNALHILNLKYAGHADTAPIRQVMERQIGNMKRLVDDLLEVSRVTRGQLELRFERVDVATVVRAAVEVSQPLIAASRHRLDVVLPEQPVYVDADVVRLAQVLANLLNNAAKYTRPEGVISLAVEVEEGGVAISVADNGIGIAEDLQPLIFDMFMQVRGSRDRAQGGLGIGLTLVKRLVDMHEGSVDVQSGGLGMGSRFTVRLPVQEAPEAVTIASQPESLVNDLTGLEVLIADDNRDAADTLAELLGKFGARVRVTYGGAEALAAMQPLAPDVAILDVGMPDVDGMAVARQVRARQDARPLLVALTGWGQRQDMLDTAEAGFDHHLTKPVDIMQIVPLLKNAQPRRPRAE